MRSPKGSNVSSTLLPESLVKPIDLQIQTPRLIHQKDLSEGYGENKLPYALSIKYPNPGYEPSFSQDRPTPTSSFVVPKLYGARLMTVPNEDRYAALLGSITSSRLAEPFLPTSIHALT